jgi:valyl-tRNA synthetase
VWEWKESYHRHINECLRKLGGSFDWTREAFTMDKNLTVRRGLSYAMWSYC